MNTWELSDTLHRAVKMAMDAGEAKSLEEAHALFSTYRLAARVGPDVATSGTLQAIVLTVVNTAARSFLGGVEVSGHTAAPLLVPWQGCTTLGEAVESLGGRITAKPDAAVPVVLVGEVEPIEAQFCVRATFDGWEAGVFLADQGERLNEAHEFAPAGVLAGALAVSEAFQHVRGSNVLAGRRRLGLSLWRPWDPGAWLTPAGVGPPLGCLPTDLWLIGLGHLGQAYLHLVLQDYDLLVPANLSTSPLTFPDMVGQKKTRELGTWCERRGFRTTLLELPFGPDLRVRDCDPQLALCGVDNALARSALEEVGFRRVIEAGLGKGVREFLAFQIHGFPGPQRARKRWELGRRAPSPSQEVGRPAYVALAKEGLEACGVTTLAGKTVGAPFVGTAVAAIVVAEIIRQLEGAAPLGMLDATLRDPGSVSGTAWASPVDPFNPGSTENLIPPPARTG